MASWDVPKRLENLLVDYLGAEDTPYVRASPEKHWLQLRRIYERHRFDSILVLNGRRASEINLVC